jgi:iron complex transport system ATP-binding protein
MTEAVLPPLVDLRGVGVVREGHRLLTDVDWRVEQGERWVLLGANGSGKTTLLQVVSTYQHPALGTASILGSRLGAADVRSLRPRIGFVGPGPASLVRGHLPAVDVVVTGKHASFVDTRWHDYRDEDFTAARRHLATLHAGHLAGRAFQTLSEGEKKRVLIARALMAQPVLLLLDEPASGLDLGARERLVDSLASLAGDPASPGVILVTHHVEEIPPGFSHLLLLAHGRVVARGPIDDVLTAGTLGATFDLPLRLSHRDGRFRAWRAPAREEEPGEGAGRLTGESASPRQRGDEHASNPSHPGPGGAGPGRLR